MKNIILILIALPLAFQNIATQIPLTNQNILFTIIIGILLIVSGFFFLKKNNAKQSEKEVPIYQGSGKKRKIVGYQRSK